MAKKKNDNVETIKEQYNDFLNLLLNGDREKLNQKNKKLLRDFEKESNNFSFALFCLRHIYISFLSWSNHFDSVNDNLEKIIYLINKDKELLWKEFTKKESSIIDLGYHKLKEIKKDERLKSFEELGKGVGLK